MSFSSSKPTLAALKGGDTLHPDGLWEHTSLHLDGAHLTHTARSGA
jgi:hypothetical protein